jgi:hypothetical protein
MIFLPADAAVADDPWIRPLIGDGRTRYGHAFRSRVR